MVKLFAFLACVAAAGCAGAPGIECHGTNWYRLGLDDGTHAAGGERERYVISCGNDFDAARYDEGFRDGSARRPKPPVKP